MESSLHSELLVHRKKTLIYTVLLLTLPVTTLAQVDFTSSNIPIVVIETDTQQIVDEHRITANMGIIDNGDGLTNNVTDPFNGYSGKISIEIRGSTSQVFPKKSYGIETQDNFGENLNVSLLNLPVENDWILYAPYSDKTLIRNIISYRLFRKLGHYAPRTKLCELVLNDEYRGVYVLIEKIKRDNNRVDISKLSSDELSGDDLTGGYIIKIDKPTGNSGSSWLSELGQISFLHEYPKYDVIAPEQTNYIQTHINLFEQLLISDQFKDKNLGYRKFIDESSFVDYFIINEISRNVDGYILSTFLYKDKDSNGGELTMGPIWDFDLSFGNADFRDAHRTDGFQIHKNPVSLWWKRLLQDETFIEDIKTRWQSIRENQFRDEAIIATIDSLSILLGEPQQRNFEKWNVLGQYIWPNYYIGVSYENEIDFLKSWTLSRLQWLDDKLFDWTGYEQVSVNFETKVYPNPFSNEFNFSFTLDSPGNISLILYDMYYPEGANIINWNSSEITGSIYALVFRINGEVASIKKLVKL